MQKFWKEYLEKDMLEKLFGIEFFLKNILEWRNVFKQMKRKRKMRYDYKSGEIIEEDGTVVRELKEVGGELI